MYLNNGPSFSSPTNFSLEFLALVMADPITASGPVVLGRYLVSSFPFSHVSSVWRTMDRITLKSEKAAQTHCSFLYNGASLAGYNLVPSNGRH